MNLDDNEPLRDPTLYRFYGSTTMTTATATFINMIIMPLFRTVDH